MSDTVKMPDLDTLKGADAPTIAAVAETFLKQVNGHMQQGQRDTLFTIRKLLADRTTKDNNGDPVAETPFDDLFTRLTAKIDPPTPKFQSRPFTKSTTMGVGDDGQQFKRK